MTTSSQTTPELRIRVGDDKIKLLLTGSAVEAVQGEAAGRMAETMAEVLTVAETAGTGFGSLHLGPLLCLRDHLQLAAELCDVLIECRPIGELDEDR